ncbi:cytochrome P450, partial [Tanacetum coccineum]
MVSLISQLLILLGILLFVLTYSYKSIKNNIRRGNKLLAPEPSGAFPFIGHLHLLQSKAPVARILGKVADDYGPVYSLRL